jgi:hypothetical protein
MKLALILLVLLVIVVPICVAESYFQFKEEAEDPETEYRAKVVFVLLSIMFFLFITNASLLYGFICFAFVVGCLFQAVGLGHIYNCSDLLLACLIPLFLIWDLFDCNK